MGAQDVEIVAVEMIARESHSGDSSTSWPGQRIHHTTISICGT
ncbi:MAG TPA: hypothetical protein VHR15_02110 [Ktedonobacterales bacterium]|nr:hypothetical protein [Ktedonobacterales bacterium]